MNKEEEREIYVKVEEIPLLALIETCVSLFESVEKLKENLLDAAHDFLSEAEEEEEGKDTLSPGMREVIRQSMEKLRAIPNTSTATKHIDGNQ